MSENDLPWMVVGYPKNSPVYYPSKARFKHISEAKMHAQSLNRLTSDVTYYVIFDHLVTLS